MNFHIVGKNVDVTDNLRETIEEKLGKLDRYFTKETNCNVTLSVEKERQKVEVTVPIHDGVIRSEQSSNDMYVSIDLVEEVIERRLRKYKNKIIDKKQGGGSNFKDSFVEEVLEPEEGEIEIIRSKRFEIKPMYPEDACVQMELLGHAFFVFNNAETGQTNVVYKRKEGNYGLIEPEA